MNKGFSLVSLLAGVALATAVQSVAQHDMKMGGHSMSASPGVKALHRVMSNQMKKDMAMKMPMSRDVDREFSRMMADHHLSGIRMAEVELRYGKSAAVRRIARNIKSSQAKERAVLMRHAVMNHR